MTTSKIKVMNLVNRRFAFFTFLLFCCWSNHLPAQQPTASVADEMRKASLHRKDVQKTTVAEPLTGFRAAVVKVNITPDEPKMLLGYQARESTGVYDSIFHRIVALDDGTRQFFLVSSEFCLISPSEYDQVADRLHREHDIDPLHFWWTATHTHSAPEVGPPGMPGVFMSDRYHHAIDTAYTAWVEQKLVEGILEAKRQLTPARLGVGWGLSQANINRRAKDIEGEAFTAMNPDGPVDRRIGLLRIDKQDGSLLALIANYPIHGTVMGGAFTEISGDAPGVVSEYVEQQTDAPLLFINGAAGNIAPIYSVYPNPQAGHLSQFRVLLGDKILEANQRIAATTDDITLSAGSLTIETPRKKDLDWPTELGNYTRTTQAGVKMVKLPVRFWEINEDIAIWSAPLELFCEISNEVRDRSPFPYTFYYGYSNGWLGYLPSEEEWQYGGYEVSMVSPFTPAASGEVTEAVVNYLQGEMQSKRPTNSPSQKKNQ